MATEVKVLLNKRVAAQFGFAVEVFQKFCERENDSLGYTFEDFVDSFVACAILTLQLNVVDLDAYGRHCLEAFFESMDSVEKESNGSFEVAS